MSRPRKDWLMTAGQTIPRIARLVKEMHPTYAFKDVLQIDAPFIKAEAINGLIWDVDGTLMTYHARSIAEPLQSHMTSLFAYPHLKHAVLSNCDEIRFEELKKIFPTIPLIRGYRAKQDLIFRTALDGNDSHPTEAVEELLGGGAVQIRKPDGDLIRHAVDVLGLAATQCVMVGDQYLTDVASANLGGIRSVKVDTYGRSTFPRSIRFTQRLERVLFRMFGSRSN